MGEDDWIGNRMLVNWTPEPKLDVRTCLYRFRILNASNARHYQMAFLAGKRNLPFSIIGTDAGLLDRSRVVDRAFLAPAQRLDVLFDFSREIAGSSVMLSSLTFDPMENDGRPVPDPQLEHPGAPLIGERLDIMRFDVKQSVCAVRTIPSTLSAMPPLPRPKGPERKFRLHVQGTKLMINGYNYHQDMRAVKVTVKRGTCEAWEIRNEVKSMPHPMHLHGFHFRVLERRGSPAQVRRLAITPSGLSAADLGWLDTVMVWPGETVRIVIDFSQPLSGRQLYMFHCHNLEHEDQGLMMNVAVID
jgi:bilirubin oxidase